MRVLVVALCFSFGCARGSGPSSTGTSSSPSASAPGAESAAPPMIQPSVSSCLSARQALAAFLATLPGKCESTADCDGYYVRASSCEPAVVLAKPGCPPERAAQLQMLQSNVRSLCPTDPVACSPRPFRAECRSGRCVDGATPPTPTAR